MAGLYLGTNTVANLYLGTTEVCSTYLGTNQPFDNCTYTPSTLTLLYQSSYGGDSDNLITDNPANGTVLSGQPGTTGTFVISAPSYPSGYEGYPGANDFPTLSSTSNISATFPASGNLNVTGPTKSGGLNTIPAPNDTILNVNVSSGSNFSASPSSFTHSLANDGQTFSFTTAVCPNNNYEILQQPTNTLFTFSGAADSNGCWSGTYTGNMNQFTPQQTTTQNTTINATATLEPYNFTATVTNNISTTIGTPTVTASLTNQANVSLGAPNNLGGVATTHTYTITGAAGGTSYVLGAFAYVQGSDHEFYAGPTYNPSNSVTINSGGSYSITVTGSTQVIQNDAQFLGNGGSTPFTTKTGACNAAGSSFTVHYVGGSSGEPEINALLYLNSDLSTGQLSSGWYYNDDVGEPIYYTYNSGISSIDSC